MNTHPHRVLFFNVVVESLRKQRALAAIQTLDELAHNVLPGRKA
jgi:hypothetical protein